MHFSEDYFEDAHRGSSLCLFTCVTIAEDRRLHHQKAKDMWVVFQESVISQYTILSPTTKAKSTRWSIS